MSIDEALSRGLISKDDAGQMKSAKKQGNAALKNLAAKTAKPASRRRSAAVDSDGSPQKILFDDLCQRLPGIPQWEVTGLIPGRKFRADIFIAPSIVVEMDGFQFHRSKEAFQKDRMRQNLFVANGFKIIRVFAKQVFCPAMRKELVDQICEAAGSTLHGI
jgi:hypothetical protein